MITPSFSITATERVLPKLALDFTTASLDARVTFTRIGNTATVTNSLGLIAPINADLPRFDYDPVTLVCKGLLIEEARTNVLVNSLIDGTNLTTQIVTTTAVAYTLSFYGTGSIVLSGTNSSTQTGSGAYPARKTYTFTPTAGALTLTVSGTVQYAQLEAGAFATSYIPTGATAVTRNADMAAMTGTNFSSWFNATEGSLAVTAIRKSSPTAGKFPYTAYLISTGTNDINLYQNGATSEQGLVRVAGSSQASLNNTAVAANTQYTQVLGYKVDSFAGCVNAGTVAADGLGTIPVLSSMYIGSINTTGFELNGWVQKVNYWPQRLVNNEIQAFSKN